MNFRGNGPIAGLTCVRALTGRGARRSPETAAARPRPQPRKEFLATVYAPLERETQQVLRKTYWSIVDFFEKIDQK
jgi:hypothetical protein